VSFVESTLALSRCIWRNERNADCYQREIQTFRYRNGVIDGYASRLHYFADWMGDNARRGRITPITADLGGEPVDFEFNFMSSHPDKYPALANLQTAAELREVEERLSKETRTWIPREHVAAAHDQLRNGDLVTIVGDKPGLFIKHAGFIDRAPDGRPRLLHASSHHKKVLLINRSVGAYVNAWPDRRGVVVARPTPPETTELAARNAR
jgi:hypothetical protein